MLKKLFLKRILAYLLDYLIIMCYAAILFGITSIIFLIIDRELVNLGPVKGNVVSFLTMTLPVFLYFYLFESSKQKATPGKKALKIHVVSRNNKNGIFIRNLIKIVPWEIAHLGIHWSVFYNENGVNIPLWNWLVLIIPQIIVAVYFFSALVSNGQSSIYDKIAKTSILEIID